ncbi:unconventional myosin-VIIa-like [Cololabis saira]|uniref:unconventional myosin-VIIa-like n=1 Tax=Cololabis saira TaxID=129043 RepID=UPI002AD24A58|nr:unconventional myosin-VIIa-like [Cololabis saira]
MLRKGEWVWADSDLGVPIGARVRETSRGHRLLVDDDGNERSLTPEMEPTLRVMHPTSVEGVDDMIKLGDMTEAGLLRNLLLRHKRSLIYTYVGSVLVAVNPYQDFPIYSEEKVKLYHGRKLGELPPHIFAIAESCYFNMTRHLRNQCCIISGESGAGKTESTKLILQYLAAVSGELSQQQIEQQILESNPILEAFGNAKTIRNDNSSRFGKYLEIFFNKDGVIEGARVEQYLLEKSRVCHQASEERNYHIFYCMLAGITAEEKKTLRLGTPEQYTFLTKGDCIECDSRNDAGDFTRIRSAMKILTFSEDQFQEILKLLAAILHLGNVCFQASTQNNMETSGVSKSEDFSVSASLLEVQKSSLAKSLTQRSFLTNKERVTKPLDAEQAADCRDAFVKAIYNKLFAWIVEKINGVIYKKMAGSPKSSFLSIGLLDIFGFENFGTNSFEQLCINFANEKLQQFFVGHIFKLEQEEYLKEDIVWSNISFSDNQGILDLLAEKPCNLLALIDEESNFPKGSDITMLRKMNAQHSKNKAYLASMSEHDTDFGICHYAGVVHYDTSGFLEKNRDAVSFDILKMIGTSKNKLLEEIFKSELSNKAPTMAKNNKIIMTPHSSIKSQTKGETRRHMPTLSGQFRLSLDLLMKALSACQPFFIRCFKPNNDKQSQTFDRELCVRQLRYSGMIDTIRVRKLGFPVRHSFKDFVKRYRVLLKTTACNPKTKSAVDCCEAICKAVIQEQDEWKMGRSQIFLKDAHDAVLERLREDELSRVAVVIQRVMLGHKDRRNFLNKRRAVMVLQKNWRAFVARKEIMVKHRFERLVSKIHGRKLQHQYQRQQAAALTIQTQVRGYQARKDLKKKKKEAAMLLQAQAREAEARRAREAEAREAEAREAEAREARAREARAREARAREAEAREAEAREAEAREAQAREARAREARAREAEASEARAREAAQAMRNDLSPGQDSPPHMQNESEDMIALELQQRLEEVIALQMEANSDWDSQENVPEIVVVDYKEQNTPGSKITPEPGEEPREVPGQGLRVLAPASRSTTPTSPMEEEDDNFDHETDEFSFSKFAVRNFQDDADHRHTPQRLKSPLLAHDDEGDALACLTLSWIILRFMGDIPEPKAADSISMLSTPVVRDVPHRQNRRLSSLVGLDQKILRKNKKKLGGRKPSAILEEPENLTEDEDLLVGEGPTLDRPLTSLEKLHIIIGYALSRRDIRDEIYCQICKQLVDNRNRGSRRQGWILLSICLGIFPPTHLFVKYLQNFVQRGQREYREYCTERLRRIQANGERKELPCWIELQAANTKQPIDVSVTLMDERQISVQIDSASTSAEACQAVARQIGLKDTYGFSLYISMLDKMWSLSNCGKHVLDAVSQCEHEMRRQGKPEKDTPWRLSIRKELFTPWHDCSRDRVSTDLIYKQVIKGLKSGDYTSEKEDEYVQLAAMHSYIRLGSAPGREEVRRVVDECIPTTLIENKSMTKWIQLITSALSEEPYAGGKQDAEKVKGALVDASRQKWPLDFSKFFDVTMTSGPPLPKSRFIAAVNWSGIFFMERRDKRFLEIPYLEVKKVNMESSFKGQSLSLSTVRGDFVLKCPEAADMEDLMNSNLEGLKQRSVYAVAQQDDSKPNDPMFLVCKRGDLLMAKKDEENSPEENWVRAVNQRTGDSGAVYKDTLQFLPTLSRPTDDMLELLTLQKKTSLSNNAAFGEETVAPVSLKEFALENFRAPSKAAAKGLGKEKLWANSKEPLKQPLIRTLLSNSELSSLACNAFTAILKYMGDYPIKHARSPLELTDQIFGPATQHEALRDEIYCQIMKQMTSNSNLLSVERGWQLLWLCTGLFPPGPDLKRYTQRFLESRPRDPLSSGCLQRLQEICSKTPRSLPPHQAEVEAIQQNSPQIFYKVHFPNKTDDIFEVSSTTTIKDLRCSIAFELNLSSPDGYGLYMKTTMERVTSLDEQKYFFDNLRQPSEVPKKAKKTKEVHQGNIPCVVMFKRKLWFNVTPGKDLVADLTFHYPQEVSKYLRGFHNCTKEDMCNLGGLLFRVTVDSDRSQFVMIPRMLNELVPTDRLKLMSPEEWKKNIISAYNKQSGITVQEAKIAFLKDISTWPTFGCAFFLVKQTCEPSYPTQVMIAISKQGVNLIDPETKELLVLHPFSRITDYYSRGNMFQMTIRTLVRGLNFVCETPQAFAMEDLVTSYVKMYEGQKQAFQPRNQIFARSLSNKMKY